MAEVDDEQPHRWYSTNLVGVPAPVLASVAFHAHPQALHIAGTREAHPGLFALLARAEGMHYVTRDGRRILDSLPPFRRELG